MNDEPTPRLQSLLERFQQGDRAAGEELLAGSADRLHRLAQVMLNSYPRLRRWEQTDDVLQSALLRLHRTLQQVTPATLRDYYRLAALQIRRELLDLVRHHYGPLGPAARLQTNAGAASDGSEPYDRADLTLDPARLALWTEWHRQVDAMPQAEQEVFDLRWYQGLSEADTAAVLGVSPRTVRRRMHAAQLWLHQALGGRMPAGNGNL